MHKESIVRTWCNSYLLLVMILLQNFATPSGMCLIVPQSHFAITFSYFYCKIGLKQPMKLNRKYTKISMLLYNKKGCPRLQECVNHNNPNSCINSTVFIAMILCSPKYLSKVHMNMLALLWCQYVFLLLFFCTKLWPPLAAKFCYVCMWMM